MAIENRNSRTVWVIISSKVVSEYAKGHLMLAAQLLENHRKFIQKFSQLCIIIKSNLNK
jgi:hypothetical protein